MATLTDAQKLAALEDMIVSGVYRSEYQGVKIEYRNMRELREARDFLQSKIKPRRNRLTFVKFKRFP